MVFRSMRWLMFCQGVYVVQILPARPWSMSQLGKLRAVISPHRSRNVWTSSDIRRLPLQEDVTCVTQVASCAAFGWDEVYRYRRHQGHQPATAEFPNWREGDVFTKQMGTGATRERASQSSCRRGCPNPSNDQFGGSCTLTAWPIEDPYASQAKGGAPGEGGGR